jgi:GntR family transcriptional regulator
MNKLAIYEQLSLEIKTDIASGILRSGDKLPSVRKFALEKKINPNTAAKVYKHLENEGVITSIPSKGNFVSQDVDNLHAIQINDLTEELKALLEQMRLVCVSKKDVLRIVEEVYHGFAN